MCVLYFSSGVFILIFYRRGIFCFVCVCDQVNPDARYVTETYPWTYWRKNLNPVRSGNCNSDDIGVDLNRNYDFMWGDLDGASDDECDSTYHGRSPHSEPETRAVVEYAKDLFPAEQRKDNPEGNMDVPLGEGGISFLSGIVISSLLEAH